MYYIKPVLKSLSQGARLEYIRELRHMSKIDVAAYFNLGGNDPASTIRKYENNDRNPDEKRLHELAKLYEVNINSIKEYDFKSPVDQIYILMWMEEQFPYYEIKFDNNYHGTSYNTIVMNGIIEWKEMKSKYENKEITIDEYINWKLNYEIK